MAFLDQASSCRSHESQLCPISVHTGCILWASIMGSQSLPFCRENVSEDLAVNILWVVWHCFNSSYFVSVCNLFLMESMFLPAV